MKKTICTSGGKVPKGLSALFEHLDKKPKHKEPTSIVTLIHKGRVSVFEDNIKALTGIR